MSDNRFLAKLASDLDKPRGFAVLSRTGVAAFLADKPVSMLLGGGHWVQRRLAGDGIAVIGQLAMLGSANSRLAMAGSVRISPGPHAARTSAASMRVPAHSISAETTPPQDEARAAALAHALWPRCERASARLKQASLAGRTITLKLKTADFRVRTRSRRLADPTQLADTLFRTAAALLANEADGVTRFRLIGVGTAALVEDLAADPPTLLNREFDRPRRLEYSMKSNSHQARRSIRTTRPRPGSRRQDPYDISAHGRKVTG